MKQNITLDEYFSKYGFGDGDSTDIGWNWIGTASEILDKHLNPFGIQTHQRDVMSIHNPCLLEFIPIEGSVWKAEDLGEMSDDDCWMDPDGWAMKIAGLDKDEPDNTDKAKASVLIEAIKAAEREFDETVQVPEWDEIWDKLSQEKRVLPQLLGIHEDLDTLVEQALRE